MLKIRDNKNRSRWNYYFIARNRIAVYINGDKTKSVETDLPEGHWKMLLDRDEINLNGINEISGKIIIPPTSGMIFSKN
jgi:hypothetical protein